VTDGCGGALTGTGPAVVVVVVAAVVVDSVFLGSEVVVSLALVSEVEVSGFVVK